MRFLQGPGGRREGHLQRCHGVAPSQGDRSCGVRGVLQTGAVWMDKSRRLLWVTSENVARPVSVTRETRIVASRHQDSNRPGHVNDTHRPKRGSACLSNKGNAYRCLSASRLESPRSRQRCIHRVSECSECECRKDGFITIKTKQKYETRWGRLARAHEERTGARNPEPLRHT